MIVVVELGKSYNNKENQSVITLSSVHIYSRLITAVREVWLSGKQLLLATLHKTEVTSRHMEDPPQLIAE
jgi:hypothetical protein